MPPLSKSIQPQHLDCVVLALWPKKAAAPPALNLNSRKKNAAQEEAAVFVSGKQKLTREILARFHLHPLWQELVTGPWIPEQQGSQGSSWATCRWFCINWRRAVIYNKLQHKEVEELESHPQSWDLNPREGQQALSQSLPSALPTSPKGRAMLTFNFFPKLLFQNALPAPG